MTEDLLQATVSVRGILFTQQGDVLIMQRATDGDWELPGGRLSQGEAVVAGLQRELYEETHFEIDVEDLIHANAWCNSAGDDRFAVYYRCSTDQRSVTLSDEHTDATWLPVPEATAQLSPPQATAVRRAAQQLDIQVLNDV